MTDLNNIVRLYDRVEEPLTEDELNENVNYYEYEIKLAELKGALHGQDDYLKTLVNDVVTLTATIYGQQGVMVGGKIEQ